tara:strand:- start:267 stop:461 length:195 start_codon:yes stop_codon:yes gene_type:complete
MSSEAEDKLQSDIEVVIDRFQDELKAILRFSSYETPMVEVVGDLIDELEFTSKNLKIIKRQYEI